MENGKKKNEGTVKGSTVKAGTAARRTAGMNLAAYQAATSSRHLTDWKVAEMMGISCPTFWRKKNGMIDFYVGELIGFAKGAHLTEKEVMDIFFSAKTGK